MGTLNLSSSIQAYRGSILHFLADPKTTPSGSYEFFPDGALVTAGGYILQSGPYDRVLRSIPTTTPWVDYSGFFIMPGLIDTHVHYPQTEMIGAYGEQLLTWLNTYTFPTEQKYHNEAYARSQADFFLQELLRNGTTCAMVFATVHKASVEALFDASLPLNMRIIAGKVLMDRHAPVPLLDTPKTGLDESKELILKWHGKGRLLYALTPRFAPTSTPEQLTSVRELLDEFSDLYVQTHLAENRSEVAWVQNLFPTHQGYFDVYKSFGLTGKRSIFAHCIYLTDQEREAMAASRSVASFCPTSNLFLGSGLFPLHEFEKAGIPVGLGTDVGAGTSFSLFRTLGEAYKVGQLQGHSLSPFEGFYLATLGGARALSLENCLGNLQAGKEADFIVVDPQSTPLMKARFQNSQSLEEKLFVLMTLADDRAIKATYIAGKKVTDLPPHGQRGEFP